MNLSVPVREYIDTLVHASARHDVLTAARHRAFIAPRVLGGLAVLSMLPVYLLARGVPGPLEIATFGWMIAALGIAFFLARSGRYERACGWSALALTAFVTVVAMLSGGVASFAAVGLVLAPIEAALGASRRIVVMAAGLALAALALLAGVGPYVSPADGPGAALLAAAGIGSAVVYAALLALATEAAGRAGSELRGREEGRYRLLAATMTDVITRHGRNGTVLFVSPAAERLFGVAAGECLGHGLLDRVHVGDRPAYLTALSDAANGGEERSVEFRLRQNRSGPPPRSQFIWVEMRCRGLDPEHPAQEGRREVVAVTRDITERRAQAEAIQEARSEAEEANAAKSRFLATMSHELRTPLNAVIGFSEMLMNEGAMQLDAAKRLDYARLIHESGHHLLSVVNIVLDMSKIESGNFVITPEPCEPGAVIRHCAELLALKARDAGLDLVLRIPAGLPEMVADKRALKQMLLNLLSNAVKFTERGGSVTVGAASTGSEIAITVEDTGVGIAAEDLPRIGDPFFQASGCYDRAYDGTGLGLSIVKGLVNLHRGRMEIASRLGEGTCVTLHLPIDCETRLPVEPRRPTEVVALDTVASPVAAAGPLPAQARKRA